MTSPYKNCNFAFPRPVGMADNNHWNQSQTGMTLWHYFAATALNGLIIWVERQKVNTVEESRPHDLAQAAGRIADAMIEECEKRRKKE